MLTKLLVLSTLVLAATMFMTQSATPPVYAVAQAGDCSSVCAVAGIFGAFAKAFGTIAFAGFS